MANRLADQTSPYLLQHAHNPVDWYPWGPEALATAKEQDRPIFLSIGYSACHWCHVMERESFENEQLAHFLNGHFISIKVDREERPDLDQIYMNAVQIMTQHGGWPMSVFLTPDLQPFFGGTYWPPTASRGMSGFDQVLQAVWDAWTNRREQAVEQAARLTEHLRKLQTVESSAQLNMEMLETTASRLQRTYDFTHGGFGGATKFPHSMNLQLLLRIWRRSPQEHVLRMVTLNLDKMAGGGIYDHLAGGFARYSVDARWLVPHFEKMLYDNALLTHAYLDGYLVTGNARYAQVARETLDYILGYMTDPLGGFHSTEDADSEGEEGKFYLWTPDEVANILGPAAAEVFCYVYDVTESGNFEGRNILNLPKTIEQCADIRGWNAAQLADDLAQARAKLLVARDQRVRPGKDDKVLTSWNGLMIDAMARASGILGGQTELHCDALSSAERYLAAASRAADFILNHMRDEDGRLLHSWRNGQAKFPAYLDDYTCLISALVSLYEASFDERWIDEATRLADSILLHFQDPDAGGFFYTADDHEQLIARNKDQQDSSVPSGNSMAATALVRLGKLCGRQDYMQAASETVELAAGLMEQAPQAMGQMLIALDMVLGPMSEIVILGDPMETDTSAVLNDLRRRYLPNCVVSCRANAGPDTDPRPLDPLFAGREFKMPSPTVYVCENFTCRAPVQGRQQCLQAWKEFEAQEKGRQPG